MPDASLHPAGASGGDSAAERDARLIAARMTCPRMRGRSALLARAACGDELALRSLEEGSLDVLDCDPLYAYLRGGGEVPVARVSSAQARGRAKKYAYWGAVQYALCWSERMVAPVFAARERATSDRRSERLAERDADELAARIGGVRAQTLDAAIEAARTWLPARDVRRSA